jgi:subtilisin family serine protease
VALKACIADTGYCFADSVAAALRHAGDVGLDIVNLSLYADPYLYYCKNDAEQRDMLKELQDAAKYAQKRGVLIVTSAGNGASDLQHPPEFDTTSPDYPPGAEVERKIGNNCRVFPTEIPGALTVSATGPIGIDDYDLWIADYSDVGMSRVDVTAPGGDYFRATGKVQDAVLGAMSSTSDPDLGIYDFYDFLEQVAYPGITALDQGARYGYLNGTSMSSPHAAGVAALVMEMHPNWSPGAVKAAVQRSAQDLGCPPESLPDDPRERCYGENGRTSFFGHGLVDAAAASK